jgi:hypothetical protein
MNTLSVSYRKTCSVMHQLRTVKVNEKHPLTTVNCFSLKDQFLINSTLVCCYYYAILHFFANWPNINTLCSMVDGERFYVCL